MITTKSLSNGFAAFQDPWSPKVAGDVNDMQIKLVKLQGTFIWHSHDEEDELFLVISGRLRMEFRDQEAQLVRPGEFSSCLMGSNTDRWPRSPVRWCFSNPTRQSIPVTSPLDERSGIWSAFEGHEDR